MSSRMSVLFALISIAACGGSPTGGEPNGDAPLDSDGVRLSDYDEIHIYGTDPFNPDTDGDSWWDGDEVDAGSDPLDPNSFPYRGGWPINLNKDDLGDPDTTHFAARPGMQLPRLRVPDQFEDTVDLYDFSAAQVPVLLEITGYGRTAFAEMQELLNHGTGPLATPALSGLAQVVADRRVWYVRVVGYGGGAAPTEGTHRAFIADYPNDASPILLDDDNSRMALMFEREGASPPVRRPWVVEIDPATMRIKTDIRDTMATLEEVITRVRR